MTVPDPTIPLDLSDDDIASTRLEPPASRLAATGIVFRGLERSEPIAMREWKGRRESPGPSAAKEKS
jgi:hypothetical protein